MVDSVVPIRKPKAEPDKTEPRHSSTSEEATLQCPFCQTNPMNVIMRFIAMPGPPQKAMRYVVVSGCGDCHCVTGTQLVKPDVVEIPHPMLV